MKALTLPCLSVCLPVCAASLSSSHSFRAYLLVLLLLSACTSCLKVQQVVGVSRIVIRGHLDSRFGWRKQVGASRLRCDYFLCSTIDLGFRLVSYLLTLLRFNLFQPNSAAAKLLEGKPRVGGASAEFHHRTGSGGKAKTADISNRVAHYGVPQVPAETSIANPSPLYSHWKQPAANSFYQTTKGESTSISTFNSFNRQGPSHHLAGPAATRGGAHASRVNSQRIRRHSDSTHRHLLQVSHIEHPPLGMLYRLKNTIRFLFVIMFEQNYVWSLFCLVCRKPGVHVR